MDQNIDNGHNHELDYNELEQNSLQISQMQPQEQNYIQQQYMAQQQYQLEPQYQFEADYMSQFIRQPSCANKQYEMGQLTTNIMQEVEKINQQTNLGLDWSLLLYNACGWKSDLCRALLLSVDQKTNQSTQKHKYLIHYTNEYIKNQGQIGKGECGVCGEENKVILRNFCGHQFCIDCWKSHFMCRLQSQFRDPFPPCMYEDCQIKMSYTLSQILCQINNQIKSKFYQVLCRSYATYNKSVKMCKGRPGVTCRKCFAIDKMFDVIECSTCGNFVCPRCGEQNHGSAQCFMVSNWKKLTEDSTQFIQFLNYKICPGCKQAVQRKQGCNSIICKCKQQFCYVCGQKWLPTHSSHGDQTCPKFKQIKMLNQEKKKIKQNSKQYYQKIQQRNSKYSSFYKQFQRVDELKRKTLSFIKADLMNTFSFFQSQLNCFQVFSTFLQKCFCILSGQTLILHFKEDKSQQFFSKKLEENAEKISDFLFQFVEKMCKCLKKEPYLMKPVEKQFISQQGRKQFQLQFPKRVKQIEMLIPQTEKIIDSFDNLNN